MADALTSLMEVKVIPGASRDEVTGWEGEVARVKLRAPPVDGRANAALCEFLAERLGLPRRAVEVRRGETSRRKVVAVTGLAPAELRARLGGA